MSTIFVDFFYCPIFDLDIVYHNVLIMYKKYFYKNMYFISHDLLK